MILINILYILFALSAIVLITVVLLQEGKGGGFTDALGAAGQQTFGVKASGIHKFTAGVAATFLISALVITILNGQRGGSSVLDGPGLDALPGPSTGAPAAGGAGGGVDDNK